MSRQQQDPHQGGSISDFAVDGTTMPNDAGRMNTIPSVPRPDQRAENPAYDYEGTAQPSTAFAADNDRDLPRSTRDVGQTGEVLTGTGNTLPASVESKRAFMGTNIPGGTGNARDMKHHSHNRSQFDRYAKEDEDAEEKIGGNNLRNE
ncbi:uncharacterized protein N7482_000943 [Penicillium canariense]|uniref:Uncharacterized protein n=1 Tax=Penicillium canariense TaxID=189055 RepID=A0A9W9IGA0_9EURO|nr:uncharacterized protein N7482_000943 [Penicillium canariense]KAJ5175066.1 hypothetical protein N7482_000943 [Penicillium canariense]